MEVRNQHFAAYIDFFTPNTYVMVAMCDPTIRTSRRENTKRTMKKNERMNEGPSREGGETDGERNE